MQTLLTKSASKDQLPLISFKASLSQSVPPFLNKSHITHCDQIYSKNQVSIWRFSLSSSPKHSGQQSPKKSVNANKLSRISNKYQDTFILKGVCHPVGQHTRACFTMQREFSLLASLQHDNLNTYY